MLYTRLEIRLMLYKYLQVMQRDVPGIDHSFLAMDTEEGVEVVWNEVQFSERKYFKSQEVHNLNLIGFLGLPFLINVLLISNLCLCVYMRQICEANQ